MKQKGSLWVFAICSQWQTMCKPSFFHVSIAEFNTSYHWRRGKKRKLLFTCYILTSSGTVCMQIIITHLPSTSSGNELFWSLQNQINLCMLQTFFSGKHKTLRPQMLTIEKKTNSIEWKLGDIWRKILDLCIKEIEFDYRGCWEKILDKQMGFVTMSFGEEKNFAYEDESVAILLSFVVVSRTICLSWRKSFVWTQEENFYPPSFLVAWLWQSRNSQKNPLRKGIDWTFSQLLWVQFKRDIMILRTEMHRISSKVAKTLLVI